VILLATWLATRRAPTGSRPAVTERPRGPFALLLPAALSACSLSRLQVRNVSGSPSCAAALANGAREVDDDAGKLAEPLGGGVRPGNRLAAAAGSD